MSEAGGAEAEQQRALLTLILAGSPRSGDDRRELLAAFELEPMSVADAISVLGRNRVQPHSALRPLVVRALGRIARNNRDLVTPEVTAALAELHKVLAVEADHEKRTDLDQTTDHDLPPLDLDQSVEPDEGVVVDHRVVAPTLDEAYRGIVTRDPKPIEAHVSDMNQRIALLQSSQQPLVTPLPKPPPPPPPPMPPQSEEPAEPGEPRLLHPPLTIHEAAVAAAHAGDPTAIYEVAMATAFGVDADMVSAPACADHAGATDDAPHSVAVSWTTRTTIDKLAPWLDPVTWPLATNGVFFKGMALIGAKAVNHPDWSADYTETVQFGPTSSPINTDLHFEHGEDGEVWDTANDPKSFRWSIYALANPASPYNELSHDDGLLQLRRIEYDDGEIRVEATCTKNFRFKAPSLDGYAELACDTWFGELAIMMSTNCGKGYS